MSAETENSNGGTLKSGALRDRQYHSLVTSRSKDPPVWLITGVIGQTWDCQFRTAWVERVRTERHENLHTVQSNTHKREPSAKSSIFKRTLRVQVMCQESREVLPSDSVVSTHQKLFLCDNDKLHPHTYHCERR